jgi:hypothetical protein
LSRQRTKSNSSGRPTLVPSAVLPVEKSDISNRESYPAILVHKFLTRVLIRQVMFKGCYDCQRI